VIEVAHRRELVHSTRTTPRLIVAGVRADEAGLWRRTGRGGPAEAGRWLQRAGRDGPAEAGRPRPAGRDGPAEAGTPVGGHGGGRRRRAVTVKGGPAVAGQRRSMRVCEGGPAETGRQRRAGRGGPADTGRPRRAGRDGQAETGRWTRRRARRSAVAGRWRRAGGGETTRTTPRLIAVGLLLFERMTRTPASLLRRYDCRHGPWPAAD
jgi:hypothetical protein